MSLDIGDAELLMILRSGATVTLDREMAGLRLSDTLWQRCYHFPVRIWNGIPMTIEPNQINDITLPTDKVQSE